jgi:hypothetical protein
MKNSEEFDLEKLELLMQSKSYAQLSREEKEWVSQWVESASEYDLLRKSEIQMRQYFHDSKTNPPASSTLAHLTNHLKKETRTQQAGLWGQFKPSLSVWSLAILFGCVGWWIGQSTSSPVTQPEVITSSIIHDTIYIASKADTIFTEKIIYKDRPVIVTRNNNSKEFKNTSSESNGINMKEKEELEKLLVSGTD